MHLLHVQVASVIKRFGLMEKMNEKVIEKKQGWVNPDVMIFLVIYRENSYQISWITLLENFMKIIRILFQ